MDIIYKEELKKLATKCIEDYGYETVEEAVKFLYTTKPDLRSDKRFNQLFPVLFDITLLEKKIQKKQETC